MNADFFARFGIYIAHGFFDADLCARLRTEARCARGIPASVRRQGAADYAVDESLRRTRVADVSGSALRCVEERLSASQPTLDRHFGVVTNGWRTPQFLVYHEGDFFHPHSDSSHDPNAPTIATGRKVSAVIFLNGESEEPWPDSYGGGALVFFGLFQGSRMEGKGLALTGEPGLLVAFRSDMVHSVTPVTHGERYTVVSWLESQESVRSVTV